MSDALCGPSNPLQQFKQQTQFDRTLQQDRLTSRQSPSQGFRSADPSAGFLDPEFEAFQAGVPPSQLPHLQPFQQPPRNHGGPVQAPSWAADFQQMSISSPPPFQQQQRIPQSGPGTANWAQGFRDHVAQATPRAQTSASSPQQFQQMARYGGGLNTFQSNFGQTNMTPNMQSKGKEPVTEQFDEAAFERAFDQARDDMMGSAGIEGISDDVAEGDQKHLSEPDYQAQLLELERQNKARLLRAREEQALKSQVAEDTDMTNTVDTAQTNTVLQNYQEQVRLLDEKNARYNMAYERLEDMHDPHQIREEAVGKQAEAQERAKEDDDALAATAQELLEKVQHNQTDKFRNSQFLSLMRKLRDREVKVEGDKMVETNDATTAAETQTVQPLNSPSAVPRFDNSEQRPTPLGTVDTRPYEYGIPHEEQDHDTGRAINAQDGQEVVDMLDRAGPMTDVTEDIASYDPESAERYGDSTNGTSSPYLMTRFPPGMRTVV